MQKRRTKKQKMAAKISYHLPQADDIDYVEIPQASVKNSTTQSNASVLMMYDNALLIHDLKRTTILTFLMLGLEMLIYYYVR